MTANRMINLWERFWMRYAGLSVKGRWATRMGALFSPPYKARTYLARLSECGYVAPGVSIHHRNLHLGRHVYIGDDVLIYQAKSSGSITIGAGSHIYNGTILETGDSGKICIGADTHVQPRCHLSGYKGEIHIGNGVQIAPMCAFYPYDHGFKPGASIKSQPLQSRGGILIDDDAWLGVGVIVLDGAKIGKGAVVGAGAVVNGVVPDGAIAAGVPARVVKMRTGSTSKL